MGYYELVEVLTGRVREHHRFLLGQHLRTIEQLEDSVAAFDARIEAALSPFHDIVERLEEVPGLAATATETVIAEIGADMSPFPTVGHVLSWAGFVPRLDESAGKRHSTRIRKGAPWLKPVLVQAAWGAAQEEQLFPGPIPPSQSAPRRQEGSDRGCRVDPHNRLSHAA